MSLDLYSDELQRSNRAGGVAGNVEPGLFEGFVRGTGMFAMKEFAKTARSVSMAGASIPVAIDAITGGTTLQDKYFKSHEDTFGSAVKFWDPDPGTVGEAGQIAGSLIGLLPQIIANPAAAVASQQLSSAEDLVTKPGVSANKAMAVGAVQAVGLGLGIWAPPALGYNLGSRIAAGAGINLLQGVLTRGASSAILDGTEAAKDFPALGGKEMTLDLLLGAAFGGAAHVVPSWRAETEAWTDRLNVKAQREIREEMGAATPFDLGAAAARVNKQYSDAISEWAQNVTPTQKAALATLRVAQHANVDSLPGRPTHAGAVDANRERLSEAIDSLLKDKPLPPEGRTATAPDARPVPETPTIRDVSDIALRQAGETPELTQNMVPARDWEILTRLGLVQEGKTAEGNTYQYVDTASALGPERDARAQIEADERAQGVPIEEKIAGLENRIAAYERAIEDTRFTEPDKVGELETKLDMLNERLATLKEERPDFEVDPEKTAQAVETTRAMREGNAEMRDPDMPEQVEVLEPTQQRLEREIGQSIEGMKGFAPGEHALAARLGATFVNALARAVAKPAGLDPDVVAARLGFKRAGAPSGEALTQPRRTPADLIERYRPRVETSQYGGRVYANDYMELGNSEAIGSGKGIKGDRRVFRIMDKQTGAAADVGFVIVEIDKNGKFAALRNIEIRKDYRGNGAGERVVATMLAHNGPGYEMDIVDITHAGGDGIGSDTDALPFWKKNGTQLINYSRDPNVQMDGMLSLEDYLGARRGRGTEEGNQGAAAEDLSADRGGRGAAAGGMRGGGPSAADRAELARINGTLFQGENGKWYYSALGRAIDNSPTKAADANGWKQWLKGLVNKGTVKADEIKATELEEYLDATQGKITKEQLQTFMQEGGVRVEEVQLGAPPDEPPEIAVKRQRFQDLVDIEEDPQSNRSLTPAERAEMDQLLGDLRDHPNPWLRQREDTTTHFASFQLPGAKEGSYREIALVLPETPATRKARAAMEARNATREVGRKEVFDRYAPAIEEAYKAYDSLPWDAPRQVKDTMYGEMEALMIQRDTEAAALHGEMEERVTARDAGAYKVPQGHSMGDKADTNRIAHIRFNERTGPNGERVLFIEEIQSDWAQQGKKYGFAGGEPELKPGYRIWQMENGRWRIDKDDNPNRAWTTNDTREGALKSALSMGAATQSDIPNAPFVGKTDAWVALSLKRMIRYAAENGFDQVAWTTGEQQAARYNLAQVVHQIDVVGRTDARTGEQTRQVVIHAKDGSAITLGVNNAGKVDNAKPADYQGKNLEDIVGKAMAEKIMANRTQTIAGDGLKIGGEGMAGFYDKIVPTVVKDVLKKLGGGKVDVVNLKTPDEMTPLEKLQEARDASGMTMNEWMRMTSQEQKAATEEYWRNKPVETMAQQGLTITPEMRAKVMEGQALFQSASPYGLEAFGIKSLDEISPAYRTPEAWREVPAAMRNVDTARALRQSVIDFEQGLNREFGWTEGIQHVWINLDANGNLSIDRAANLTPEQRLAVVEGAKAYADANDLGLTVRRSAAGDLGDDLLSNAGLKNWISIQQTATGVKAPPNQVLWVKDPRGAALFRRPVSKKSEARGFLDIAADRKLTIGLLDNSDPSTLIHEPAHAFLEILNDLAKTTPELEGWMKIFFDDNGITRQQWDGWGINEKRVYHERFARGFESYVMSGKAPTEELRNLFQRFRDWLIAIYKSATSLNVKVSKEMEGLYAKLLGSEQADPSTTAPAPRATDLESPPPPPSRGEEGAPAAGGMFDDLVAEKPAYADKTIDDPDMREVLRTMAESEAGWAQIGGRNLTGETGVFNRSTWIPKAEWWLDRPDNIKKLKEAEYYSIVDKALMGEPLKPIEQRAIDFMLAKANERLRFDHEHGPAEVDALTSELQGADLDPSLKNLRAVDAVAIAHQIDPAKVERLAMEFQDDDAGFVAGIERMIDDHKNSQAAASSAENQPAPAKPAADTNGARSAADPLALEADRVAAELGDQPMEITMPDGTTQTMTAAQYLTEIRDAAGMAREDIVLIQEAAQCLLGAI
jgi:hypothetical protein